MCIVERYVRRRRNRSTASDRVKKLRIAVQHENGRDAAPRDNARRIHVNGRGLPCELGTLRRDCAQSFCRNLRHRSARITVIDATLLQKYQQSRVTVLSC